MVVFWIIGGLFFAIGLIVSIPTLLKILKCISIDSTDKNARAIYEYAVAGKKYTGKTNRTSNGIFRMGGECHVLYEKRNPGYSYIKLSGQYIRCVIGVFFAILGLAVLLLGIFWNTVL